MALLKLKRHAQVTIPAELRKQFNLEEGDYLEAEATSTGILLRPVSVVERERAWDKVIEVIEGVHAKQPQSDQSPEEQEEEIENIVQTSRQKHAESRFLIPSSWSAPCSRRAGLRLTSCVRPEMAFSPVASVMRFWGKRSRC